MNFKAVFSGIFITIIFGGCELNKSFELYLETASDSPKRFLPEVLDSSRNFRDITFIPEMKKFYFSEIIDKKSRIMYSEFVKGKWSEPKVAVFSGIHFDAEPKFSFKGEKLFFMSDRPSKNKSELINDFDIWVIKKIDGRWDNPQCLGTHINTTQMEYFPSVTKLGKLYFGRNDKSMTRGNIYSAVLKNGEYIDSVKLSSVVNLENTSFNAFISPDENYIIFSSYVKGEHGYHSDMFISFNNKQTGWKKPVNLGKEINSPGLDHSPYVTNNGKYFFFSSTRKKIDSNPYGNHNIFFMKADFIKTLKQKTE